MIEPSEAEIREAQRQIEEAQNFKEPKRREIKEDAKRSEIEEEIKRPMDDERKRSKEVIRVEIGNYIN